MCTYIYIYIYTYDYVCIYIYMCDYSLLFLGGDCYSFLLFSAPAGPVQFSWQELEIWHWDGVP